MAVQEGTFSILANKALFTSKWALLLKATGDNDSPTPGYMFQEIINVSNESGSHCVDLLEVLVERLQDDSSNVKLKVLRIMKHLVEKGHPDFKSGLRKKSRGIKAATKHNGPPDPLHGNVPYLLVRKEAQGLLSILFEEDDASQVLSSQGPHSQQKTMGSISSVGIGSVDSSGNLRGFGNTAMKESKSLTESFISGVKDVVEKVLDPHPLGREVPRKRETQDFSQYKPLSIPEPMMVESQLEMPPTPQPVIVEPRKRIVTKTAPRQAGRAGGGWEEEEVVLGAPQQQQSMVLPSISPETTIEEEQIVGSADTAAEERLTASWLKVDTDSDLLPTRREVEEFCKQCAVLNCDKIGILLNTGLKDDRDQILMRCMLAIERLLHLDFVTADHMAAACTQNLLHLSNRPDGAVHWKARKIVAIMKRLCSDPDIITNIERDMKDKTKIGDSVSSSISSSESAGQMDSSLYDANTPSPTLEALKLPFAGAPES